MFSRRWSALEGDAAPLVAAGLTDMRLRPGYAAAAAAIFLVEAGIALFVNDAFVRPYGGDVLAVALVYCLLRAAAPLGSSSALAATLLIAGAVELAQLLNLLDATGLRANAVVRTVLGGSFDVLDLAAYLAGALLVALVEAARARA